MIDVAGLDANVLTLIIAVVVMTVLLYVFRKQPWIVAVVGAVVGLFLLFNRKKEHRSTEYQSEIDVLKNHIEETNAKIEEIRKQKEGIEEDISKRKEELEHLDVTIEERRNELRSKDIGDRADATASEWERRGCSG